jgi:hypothetical protein
LELSTSFNIFGALCNAEEGLIERDDYSQEDEEEDLHVLDANGNNFHQITFMKIVTAKYSYQSH